MDPTYTVQIEPIDNDRRWKVVWTGHNWQDDPYFLNVGEIVELADTIRAILAKLVERSTKGELSRGERSRAIPVLRELMKQGHKLYRLFFQEDEVDRPVAKRIQAELASREDRPQICFRVNSAVHVPWALMSERAAPAEPEDGALERYRGFWALKYSVATVHNRVLSPADFRQPYPAAEFEALVGVDTNFHQKASNQLEPGAPEAELFSLLQARFDAPVTTSQSLFVEWTRREARLGLLYLYCHSSEKRIAFSTADALDTADFKLQYKKKQPRPPCLVFLNGCHTAVGGFLQATGRTGFCGFVGAETILPYMFAHRFGAAVIASLYAGEFLVTAIDRLREQHWPLSLVYGLYAYPFLQLAPSFSTPALPADNYSDLPVGDETL